MARQQTLFRPVRVTQDEAVEFLAEFWNGRSAGETMFARISLAKKIHLVLAAEESPLSPVANARQDAHGRVVVRNALV